jgi:hypothetical protein
MLESTVQRNLLLPEMNSGELEQLSTLKPLATQRAEVSWRRLSEQTIDAPQAKGVLARQAYGVELLLHVAADAALEYRRVVDGRRMVLWLLVLLANGLATGQRKSALGARRLVASRLGARVLEVLERKAV